MSERLLEDVVAAFSRGDIFVVTGAGGQRPLFQPEIERLSRAALQAVQESLYAEVDRLTAEAEAETRRVGRENVTLQKMCSDRDVLAAKIAAVRAAWEGYEDADMGEVPWPLVVDMNLALGFTR